MNIQTSNKLPFLHKQALINNTQPKCIISGVILSFLLSPRLMNVKTPTGTGMLIYRTFNFAFPVDGTSNLACLNFHY
jgi:hypothetical protein